MGLAFSPSSGCRHGTPQQRSVGLSRGPKLSLGKKMGKKKY